MFNFWTTIGDRNHIFSLNEYLYTFVDLHVFNVLNVCIKL